MLPLLAQDNAPTFTPGQLAAFLGIAFFLLGLVVLVRKVFGHEPPLHKEYLTRDEHARDFKILQDDLTKGAASRKQMHGDIEKIGKEQAALKKETEGQTRDLADVKQQIQQVNDRIDSIPERTIRLLNETKQLHR